MFTWQLDSDWTIHIQCMKYLYPLNSRDFNCRFENDRTFDDNPQIECGVWLYTILVTQSPLTTTGIQFFILHMY